jgi:hypothetical protein
MEKGNERKKKGGGGEVICDMTCIDIFVWEPCQGTARKARLRMEI